ncbi:Hsp20/alpha crystallin family protein [Haloarchaeobius sp. DT45]|uniref:Hsp20/alpha crystallin family protein n=1 Tax=Haloarchaeobius sp. DT45 TaxID=3446116 RepID=UPI003F6AA45F
MRRNPFEEFEEMIDRMSQQFDQSGMSTLETVPIDMQDHGDEYEVIADLPGFASDDIELTFSEGTLHLDASREEETEEGSEEAGRYIHRERRESVSRSIRVPEPVDEDGITASFNNGALTIRLPKEEADEGHTIDIS